MNGMNFLDLVKARYSVRSYRPQAVEREKVEYLLECARLAPSAVNFQPWRFFVVASDARREALRRCYHREWFAEAPLCIAVCVDESVSWKRKSDGHTMPTSMRRSPPNTSVWQQPSRDWGVAGSAISTCRSAARRWSCPRRCDPSC